MASRIDDVWLRRLRRLVKVLLLLGAGAFCELYSVWNFVYEPWLPGCEGQALPANQSGIKILSYGPMKTGTKSIARALHAIGIKRSFHSEEFMYHIWAPLADRYWSRPENGGLPTGMATPFPPARKGHMFQSTHSDFFVLQDLDSRREDLARQISKCNVDSMVFDGIERLFWPVFDVSPGAKVIVLDWRTQKEWNKSESEFTNLLLTCLFFLGLVQNSIHLLPWAALVMPLIELLFGRPIHSLLTTADPLFYESDSPFVTYMHRQMNQRRIMEHWASGLTDASFVTKRKWVDYWDMIREVVPEENRLSFNMKKMGYKELCDFLGVEHPNCRVTGALPKLKINILNFEREHPVAWGCNLPLFWFLHWLNYRIFFHYVPSLFRAFLRLLRGARKSKEE